MIHEDIPFFKKRVKKCPVYASYFVCLVGINFASYKIGSMMMEQTVTIRRKGK
jgi:hypothetical protein